MTRKTVWRLAVATVIVGALTPFALLEALYQYNIHSMRPLPDPTSAAPLDAPVAAALWRHFGGTGMPTFEPAYPWRMVDRVLSNVRVAEREPDPDGILAYAVARLHLFRLQREGRIRGQGHAHFKSVFMTWWVLRNYTAQQALATYAAEYPEELPDVPRD